MKTITQIQADFENAIDRIVPGARIEHVFSSEQYGKIQFGHATQVLIPNSIPINKARRTNIVQTVRKFYAPVKFSNLEHGTLTFGGTGPIYRVLTIVHETAAEYNKKKTKA